MVCCSIYQNEETELGGFVECTYAHVIRILILEHVEDVTNCAAFMFAFMIKNAAKEKRLGYFQPSTRNALARWRQPLSSEAPLLDVQQDAIGNIDILQ